MILFQRDWAKYPTAIVDLKTTNDSFIHIARVYKAMGVENHAWPLALVHPQLQGVNPFSPDLTQTQKILIRLECEINPWYIFREIIRLPGAGAEPVRFRANRGNMAMLFSYFNHVDAVLIQPRQTHKSGSTDSLWISVMDLLGRNTTVFLITKDAQLRGANIERLKGIRSLLPEYLVTLSKDDSDNQHELTNKFLGNRFRTGVGRSSESAANNLGRGMTAANFHCDEGPFIPWIGVTLEAALSSGTAARLQAKASNQPYGNIFTTTAGRKDSRDGRYMYNLVFSGATWDERFFDAKDQADFEELVRKAGRSEKPLVNITMSHRQLGYSDEWLYEAMSNAMRNPEATKERVEADFLNRWMSGTLSSPLSVELNELIFNSAVDPSFTELTPERYTFRWYVPKDLRDRYMAEGNFVLGADTSDAVGRDASAFVLMDLSDLSVVASATVRESNLLMLGGAIANFLIRYPKVTLVMEKKSSGQSLFDIIVVHLQNAGIDPFKRIFNRIVDERTERGEQFKEIQRPVHHRNVHFYDPFKSYFGFNTSESLRRLLFGSVLQEAAKTSARQIRDKTLVTEIVGLVIKNDRIDHKESGNDDHVFAWLLANWFARYARNIGYYGIELSYVMQAVDSFDAYEDDQYKARVEHNRRLIAQIEALSERLSGIQDPIVLSKMTQRIRQLASTIDRTVVDNHTTIDQLLEQIEQQRNARLIAGGRRRISLDL